MRVVRMENSLEFFLGDTFPLEDESESEGLLWWWREELPISSLLSFLRICSSRSCCMSTCWEGRCEWWKVWEEGGEVRVEEGVGGVRV